MVAIGGIGRFRIHLALFVFCSELVGLSTLNSTRYGQERNILRLFQRWRWQSGLNGWKCGRIQNMDPFMDPVHGPPLWTTHHFVKKIFKREREVILALIWTISAILSHRHLKNSGGIHDPCHVRTVGRTGQFVRLVCSGEGLDERNECIFAVRVTDESLWSHQFEIDGKCRCL